MRSTRPSSPSTRCRDRRCAQLALVLALALPARAALGLTLRHTYVFDAPLQLVPGPSGQQLRAEALPRTWELGQPEIPYDVITLLVPLGSRPVAVRAHAGAEEVFARAVDLEPARAAVNDEGRTLAPKPMRSAAEVLGAAIETGISYPARRAEIAGGGALHGYQLLSLRVYPLRYEPGQRDLLLARRLDLEIDLDQGRALPLQRQRYSASIEADARRTLEGMVANRTDIDAYMRRIGVRVEKPPGGFHPTDAPSLEGSDVDYVIITTDALAASYQPLADWKTRRGVPAVVRTVEWIQANYRRGSDVQETIRRFIQDAYLKWGVQWVLLAGDTDLLPARYGHSDFDAAEKEIPTDLYFGCLDGNWNLDGDATWGEAALDASTPVDSTDLYAEVYVGRATTSTPSKASAYVAKVIGYENPSQTSYQNRLLMLGEVLFPVNWDSTQSISMDGASFCEDMVGQTGGCTSSTRLYQNYTDYPGSVRVTRQASINEMNAGYGIVNHIGHGFRYSMSLGDRSLVNADAMALTNVDKRFVLYMLNCTASSFDFPCLAEAFLESGGGAVAILGATRAAYPFPSRGYNLKFFEALYQQNWVHVGQTYAQSRLPFTPNAWFEGVDHYTHLLYALLGDPELVVHTCALGTTTASFPSSISLGLTNVTVTVNVGGSPRAGALVCLQKGTEEYEFGTTAANGSVTLPFRAETAGLVQVTVSGQNMRTFLGTLNVFTGGVAYVRTSSVTIDDNTTGSSSGNNDGVLDAGETLELNLVFANGGSAVANSVTGSLRIPSPYATVVDSTYSLGNIAASGGTASANGQVYFTVASNTPDGTVLPLTFVTKSGTTTWTDVVNKLVHAPSMRLALLRVEDPAPGGNNNGRIDAGETFDLLAYFKNYGTGAADGLQATLASSDPDVTIFNGAVTIGRANSMQEVTGATHLRLRETALQENAMTLTLTDNRARTLLSNITLRGPAAATNIVLDATTGPSVVLVSCTPAVETDLAGYHVYRGPSASGPWTRATLDRTTRVAYFRDTGLNPATRYYYYMTVLDTSGNESVPSQVLSIGTNPAQLGGWPIAIGGSGSSSPVVGDITGDGSKEIVVGNEHLYAWNNNGIELRDDDGDPQTWGVFSNEVQVVNGAVALAQVDNLPGYEVFVTSWEDSNKAWVVRGDGSIQPGWPRKPDPTSTQKGYWAASSAMDVDGDGRPELFAPAKNGNLYAWHSNGTPLGASEAFKSGLGTYSRSAVTFANLDFDPGPEIVYGAANGTLNIWNNDGSNFGSFPKSPGTLCLSNTAIGDVDHDGVLDVVMITEGGAVNVYNTRTGAQLPGWPKNLQIQSDPKTPSPALADLDFDGRLEIIVAVNFGAGGSVRVYNYQGVVRSGWPINLSFTSESSPIVADVSGDGIPDILFGNQSGLVYGWDRNGVDLPGFPLSVGDWIRSVPYANDVDDDGDIDLVLMGWDKNVYVWDFPVPYVAAAAQWPTLLHDAQHTGNYGYRITRPTDVGDPSSNARTVPARAFLGANHPNPFNPVTSIPYGIPDLRRGGKAAIEVRLDIFDVHGKRVRQLLSGAQVPGNYNALWDGRDDRGRLQPSGVYFCRLQVEHQTSMRKLSLLK